MARRLGTTFEGGQSRDGELDVTSTGDTHVGTAGAGRPRLSPGSTIGRYVVLGEIGAGAMGVVLAAFDPELNRKVALKLLVPKSGAAGVLPPAARLLREAQAIARLSHPNVVNVYEVGRHNRAIFIAMEFIDGVPLTRWLVPSERSLEEVLRVFVEAGRGLAAAHAAGLVHRDFKPDNVLVGRDGRVRVLDFGLARADPARYSASFESDLLDPEPGVPAARAWSDSDVLNTSLTRDDIVVGTPRFMAPEQHAGDGPDARSDQYSFCVALYHALYGQDPFCGATLRQLAQAKQRGCVAAVPEGSTVPPWLEDAVLRGLSVEPSERWPAMDPLVAALQRTPSEKKSRGYALVGGAAAFAAVMAMVGYQQGTTEPVCEHGQASVARVWSEADRTAVAAAIVATDLPFADHTRTEVLRRLDAYGTRWEAARLDACEATHVRGEQSGQLLDLRMACLRQSLDGLGAFVDVMIVADGPVVGRAVQAASALPDIDHCADIDRLHARVALPADDATRDQIGAVEGKLAHARVLQTAGKLAEALSLAQQAHADAEAAAYPPIVAAALNRVGSVLESKGDYTTAEAKLREAWFIALRAGDDERAATAATRLTSVVGDRLARYEAGLLWGQQADVLLERAGIDGLARAGLDNSVGNVLYRQGEYVGARAHYVSALAVRERILGEADATLGLELINLGNLELADGKPDEALRTFTRSQEIIDNALGPEHPNVMLAVLSRGIAHQEQGHYRQARELFAEALPVLAESMGESHPFVATAALNLGNALLELGETSDALTYLAQAERIYRESLGAAHPNVASVQFARGLVHVATGDDRAARRQLEDALKTRREYHGQSHLEVAEVLLELGRLEHRAGRTDVAAKQLTSAVAIFDAVNAPEEVLAEARAAVADVRGDARDQDTQARAAEQGAQP